MSDGLYRPKYRDRKGQVRTAKIWWLRSDPVTHLRISTGATTREAAKLFKAERERLAADPNYSAANETTIGHWVDVVVEAKKQYRAAGTAHMYRQKLGHVLRLFGAQASMASITPRTVDVFVDKRRAEGAVNNTIGKELTAIHQLCKFAKRGGAYPGDIKALKPIGFSIDYTPGERVFSEDEIATLRAGLPAQNFAVVALFVTTSCRDSEASKIVPEHYDRARHLLHIPGTKTEGSKRTIPIVTPFRELFEATLPHLPLKFKNPSRVVSRGCKKLGLPHATANDCRRTCASRLVASGVAFAVAAKILGHVDSKMLERVYARMTDDELSALAEAQIGLIPSKTAQREFGECTDGKCDSSCFIAVAPSGLEPEPSEDARILKPHGWIACSGTWRKKRWFDVREGRPLSPDSTASGLTSSKTPSPAVLAFRAASAAWFKRGAA